MDSALSAVELAAAGAGVTVIYRTYAERPLAKGRLAAPLDAGVPAPLILGMSRNPHRRETAAVRDFMGWATALFPVAEGQITDARKGG